MIDVIAWKQSKGPKSGSEITQAVGTPAHTGPEGLRGGETTRQEPRNVCGRQSERPFPFVWDTRDLETSYNRRVTVTGFVSYQRASLFFRGTRCDPLLPFS